MDAKKRLLLAATIAGLAVSSAAAQSMPGFTIENYAFLSEPQRLSFNPDNGDLFVGQGFQATISSPIRLVSGVDQSVSDFGPGIQDADAVLYDGDGSLTGIPGAVLIGAGVGLFAITPGEMLMPIIAPREGFTNPTDFAMLNDGRVMFSDFQGAAIINYALEPTPSAAGVTMGLTPTTEALAVDPATGTLYSADRTGTILSYETVGFTPTPAFVADGQIERSFRWMTTVQDQPGFTDGLLVWDDAQNELLLFEDFDLTSTPTLVGSNFEGVKDLEFGPDGALYVALGGIEGRILRVSEIPAPGALAALGVFSLASARRRRDR